MVDLIGRIGDVLLTLGGALGLLAGVRGLFGGAVESMRPTSTGFVGSARDATTKLPWHPT